jgi:hypothetical protein
MLSPGGFATGHVQNGKRVEWREKDAMVLSPHREKYAKQKNARLTAPGKALS